MSYLGNLIVNTSKTLATLDNFYRETEIIVQIKFENIQNSNSHKCGVTTKLTIPIDEC